jgi:hypothetical protein
MFVKNLNIYTYIYICIYIYTYIYIYIYKYIYIAVDSRQNWNMEDLNRNVPNMLHMSKVDSLRLSQWGGLLDIWYDR